MSNINHLEMKCKDDMADGDTIPYINRLQFLVIYY